MTKDIIKSTLKTLAPVSWVKPAVCPAGEWLELQHRERPTETWCPPAPGACLWVACGGLWAGGVCTELRCSPSSLDRSGWAWLCQSWCCSRSVLPPVCTSNHKYHSSVKGARSSPHRSCFSECAHTHFLTSFLASISKSLSLACSPSSISSLLQDKKHKLHKAHQCLNFVLFYCWNFIKHTSEML